MKKINYSLWSMIFVFLVFAFAPIELKYRYYVLAILPFYVGILNLNILKKALYFSESERKIKLFIDKYGSRNGMIIFTALFVVFPILLAVLILYSGYNL